MFEMKLQKKVSVRRSVGLELISSPEVRVSCAISAFIPFRVVLPAFTIPLMTLKCLRLCFLVFAPSPQFVYVHDASALCWPFPFPAILTLCLTLMDLPHILTTHAHLYTCQKNVLRTVTVDAASYHADLHLKHIQSECGLYMGRQQVEIEGHIEETKAERPQKVKLGPGKGLIGLKITDFLVSDICSCRHLWGQFI